MFVLDTDILTLLFAGHPRVLSRNDRVSSRDIGTTVVSYIQSLMGRFQFLLTATTGTDLLRAQYYLDGTTRSLAKIDTVLSVDIAAGHKFDELRKTKKLRKIGRADLLIASITLARGDTLVTRNLSDFRQVPDLKIENWAD